MDATNPKPKGGRRWVSRTFQAERYGVCVRTIKRWGEDPEMGMPLEYDIGGPKRDLDELEPWERRRVKRAR